MSAQKIFPVNQSIITDELNYKFTQRKSKLTLMAVFNYFATRMFAIHIDSKY